MRKYIGASLLVGTLLFSSAAACNNRDVCVPLTSNSNVMAKPDCKPSRNPNGPIFVPGSPVPSKAGAAK